MILPPHFWYLPRVEKRKSAARASELLFIARHSVVPDTVFSKFRVSPDGGEFHDGKIRFEWGNIKTLTSGKIHKGAKTVTVSDDAKYIYHLDRLKKPRRVQIETSHALPSGSISGSLSNTKADVLVVDGNGRPYFVSFKEIEGLAKLGQLSANTSYGVATLDGGIDDLDTSELPIPTTFDHRSTLLSSKSFAGISSKDQKLAYYKRNHPLEWKNYVDHRNSDAASQLREFGRVMCNDRDSFIEFIGSTLAGSLRYSPDFYIVIGDELIQLRVVLDALRSSRWHVTTSDASTTKKHAILLTVCDANTTYTLTRIEQSFEGARATVSQTKGIVYHYQQHPRDGFNYKRLLLDLR